jgi:hypothetical protein
MRRQQRKEAGRGGNQVTGTDDEQSGEVFEMITCIGKAKFDAISTMIGTMIAL